MDIEIKNEVAAVFQGFKLPRYHEIPNVGLFLEQTTKYISDYLEHLPGMNVTSSMISNYVKKKLVENPVKKQYDREQIAYLIFIMIAKSVLSLENLQLLMTLQKRTYTAERAYDYFCDEFENILQYVFGIKDTMDVIGQDNTEEKILLRNTIIGVVHKTYLEACMEILRKREA